MSSLSVYPHGHPVKVLLFYTSSGRDVSVLNENI